MRGAPHKGFAAAILPDQGGDLGIDGRAASGGPTGELGPVLAEASALPSQDGVGRHDDESLPPAGPDSGQPDPEEAIDRAEPRPGHRSLVDGELLAQGQVLEGELAVAADEEGEEPKQVERRVITSCDCGRTGPTDQPLAGRTRFFANGSDSSSPASYRQALPAMLAVRGERSRWRIEE